VTAGREPGVDEGVPVRRPDLGVGDGGVPARRGRVGHVQARVGGGDANLLVTTWTGVRRPAPPLGAVPGPRHGSGQDGPQLGLADAAPSAVQVCHHIGRRVRFYDLRHPKPSAAERSGSVAGAANAR
jgi:hypothetical protein